MSSTFSPQTIDLSASDVQLVQTSQSNPRITLDKTGLKSYDASGTIVAELLADGTALASAINAKGVALPAAVGSPPAGSNQIQWNRQADGALVAILYSTELANADLVELVAFNPLGQEARANITAEDATSEAAAPKGLAQLAVTQDNASDAATLVQVRAASHTTGIVKAVRLIDATGASDLLQKANNLADLPNVTTARGSLGLGSPTRAFLAGTTVFNFTAGASVAVPLDSVDFDTAGNFNAATHAYTVPAAGTYLVTGNLRATATAAGQELRAQIWRNGAAARDGNIDWEDTASGLIGAGVVDLMRLVAGDTIQLAGICSAALAAAGGTSGVYLSVTRLSA